MKLLLSDEFDLEFATSAEKGLTLLGKKPRPRPLRCHDARDGRPRVLPGRQGRRIPQAHPVILVTARTGAEMLAEGIEAGADDYIAKPFDSVELKARIRSLLRMRQVESELALANRNLKMRTSISSTSSAPCSSPRSNPWSPPSTPRTNTPATTPTRVTEFTLKIARKMSFSEKELGDLELAALLHDVGKIGVPEHILNKPGPLTRGGITPSSRTPGAGREILKPVVELRRSPRSSAPIMKNTTAPAIRTV